MAVVLFVDGSQQYVVPQQPPVFTLAELQALVGGYVDADYRRVGVVWLADGNLLLFDESGKLKGLPYNERATWCARGCLLAGDVVVGPALVLSREEMGE